MNPLKPALLLTAGLCVPGFLLADDAATPAAQAQAPAPVQTKHQMMKDCMAKQKASDGGIPKEDMKRNCKDVTKTEIENEKTEQRAESQSTPTPHESSP